MKWGIFLLLFLLTMPATALAADSTHVPVEFRIHTNTGKTLSSFYPFGKSYAGRVDFDIQDMNQDGIDEIIIGGGMNLEPSVKILNQNGDILSEFIAYHPLYRSGVNVTTCDIDNDGDQDIVTGTFPGGGPHVQTFSQSGEPLYGGFFAYGENFRGGVDVTCADIDRDGRADIVTAPGISGGPHIKVFSPEGELKYEVFAGEIYDNAGATVMTEDIDNDGRIEIITGSMGGSNSLIRIFEFDTYTQRIAPQSEFDSGIITTDGIELGITEAKNNALLLTVSPSNAPSPEIHLYDISGKKVTQFDLFKTENHGAKTTRIRTENGIHQISASNSGIHRNRVGKNIIVDVGEQALYTFEHGAFVNSFLVSTGLQEFETPRGEFSVTHKLPKHDYRWVYGENDPRNYDLPNVKWNLRFKKYFYIHSAPWHNNFGRRMSHGCVNVREDNAEWIFHWADVDTPVEIID